jgi:cellulose synthase/poly-beta-1,6-N-acetylglucosamine synthase-like glycosyltransferase
MGALTLAVLLSTAAMIVLRWAFWVCAGLLAWTHVGYSLCVAALARVRPRPVRRADISPTVTLVVAAHDEQDTIQATVRSLLGLDYPAGRLGIVVASDGCTDATDEIVAGLAAQDARVTLLACPRGGKVLAQDRAVRASTAEIVAFCDANGEWEPDALARLVGNFADPDVAYACGNLRLRRADGTNREGLYWRYELWLRNNEARIGSITAGNGGIYAVRRSDYLYSDSAGRAGHDLGLPYRLVQRGRRAVSDGSAVAWESPATDSEDEYRRKVRMSARCWQHVAGGRMLRGGGPLFLMEIVSHRLLRYLSGILHVVAFLCCALLAPTRLVYAVALWLQIAWLALAACGARRLRVPLAGLAWYYLLITAATVSGLWRYLRVGVPVVWEQAEGTRASSAGSPGP